MKTRLVLLLVLVTLLLLSKNGFSAIPDQYLEGKALTIESKVGEWKRTAGILQTLTFLVAALGILIAAMQAASGRWVKATVVVLSVATALIVAYNQTFFAADHRSFERLAKFAEHKVRDFRDEVEPLTNIDADLRRNYIDKFRKIMGEIEKFEEETLKGAVASSPTAMLSWPGISSAYAGNRSTTVRAPQWLNNPPQDERYIYFAGVAEGKTVEAARSNSLSSARSIAAKTIENAAQKSPLLSSKKGYVADFVQAVTSSLEVVDTYVTPNKESGDYRASTLLRLSKSVAAFSAETFFVDKGITYDKPLISGLQNDTSSLTADAQRATATQRLAVNNGVVYLHIAREEDRPVAEALRQSLSNVISAPGVEKAPAAVPSNVVRYFRTEDADLAGQVEKAAEKFMADEGYKTDLTLENLSGSSVKGSPEQLEIWLGEIPKPQPRVYFEIEPGTSAAPEVLKVKSALEAKGFTIPKMEEISGIRSSEARVFYYKASDAQLADRLVQNLSELGLKVRDNSATKISGPADARPGHFDLRIGKDAFRDSE